MQYSNTHQHRCGGTILSPIWVVIAAHCVDGNRPKIVIKAGKLNITATEPTEQTVEVERLIIHENFVNTEKRNDIAMLKLVKPLKFNAYVNKIDLPVKGSEPTGRAILSGWGSTSRTLLLSYPYILQAVTLQLMNATTCANDVAIERSPYHVDPNNVCTSAGNAGLSACAADSGSPLIQGKKLVGITTVAFINPCGTARPTIYTKVSYFVDWIHHKMNNH